MPTIRKDITDNEVIELYNAGKNYREIAHHFKTGSKVIVARLNRNGIFPKKLVSITRLDVDNNYLLQQYNEGISAYKLSKLVGISDVTVCNRLKSMGVIFPPKKIDNILIDDIKRKYLNEKKSTIEIGNEHGVSHTYIRRKLNEAGISLRSKKEANEKYARINECIICGTKFRVRAKWTDNSNSHKKTCSDVCHKALMSSLTRNERSGQWIDGSSQGHYQRVARELKEQVCEICGEEIDRIDTHHEDRDHANNTGENLHMWCVKCHAKYHYITDCRGLRGWNPNTPKLVEFRKRLDDLGINYAVV